MFLIIDTIPNITDETNSKNNGSHMNQPKGVLILFSENKITDTMNKNMLNSVKLKLLAQFIFLICYLSVR